MRVNIKEGLSDDQVRRQQMRSDKGKYSKYPLCELCGKTISGGYSSDERCNVGGFGLVLHKKCCGVVGGLCNQDFVDRLGKELSLDRRRKYISRLNEQFPSHR